MFFRFLFLSLVCMSGVLCGKEGVEVPQKNKKTPLLQEEVIKRIVRKQDKGTRSTFEKELSGILEEVLKEGYVWRVGSDEHLRPLFVTAEGLIEEVFSNLLNEGKVSEVCGAIHTPTPATPLCTDGTITENLVDKSIEKDTKRLVTVTYRAGVVRDYLGNGGKLFVVYPKGGDLKRTEAQRLIFHDLLQKYPQRLFDCPIDRTLPPLLIGATYRVKGGGGEEIVFSIGAVQANAPSDDVTWRLWLGNPRSHRGCSQRLHAIECLVGRRLR